MTLDVSNSVAGDSRSFHERALDVLIDALADGYSGSSVLAGVARELKNERDGEPETATSDDSATVPEGS